MDPPGGEDHGGPDHRDQPREQAREERLHHRILGEKPTARDTSNHRCYRHASPNGGASSTERSSGLGASPEPRDPRRSLRVVDEAAEVRWPRPSKRKAMGAITAPGRG